MAIHYKTVKRIFRQAPVALLLGQPNTYKTLLSKVTASLVGGIHRVGLYDDMSNAWLGRLLNAGLFFIYNDPAQVDLLKVLISKVSFLWSIFKKFS